MLRITPHLTIAEEEIETRAVRACGPGGQNVNKLATAAHLRFDVRASSLPDVYKRRLLALRDRRISRDGVVVIKASTHRSLEKNRSEARRRLCELIRAATVHRKRRVVTQPGRAARERRLLSKHKRSRIKTLRQAVRPEAE